MLGGGGGREGSYAKEEIARSQVLCAKKIMGDCALPTLFAMTFVSHVLHMLCKYTSDKIKEQTPRDMLRLMVMLSWFRPRQR